MAHFLKRKIYHDMYLNSFSNGITTVKYPPREIFIEPTNHCNLRCIMCPQYRGLKRKKGFMDIELYKKIIEEIKEFNLRRLNLFNSGESLMHPKLAEMIRIAKEANIYVRLHTNGTLLKKKLIDEILSSELDMISFSFDGETKEKYESMRLNSNYEDVLNKIKSFLSEKKRRRKEHPYVQIQVIKDYNPTTKAPIVDERFKKHFNGLPVDSFDAIWFLSFGEHYLENCPPKGKYYEPCRQLWSRFVIAWDGRAIACCVDADGENIIGDIRNDTVFEIWNGKKMVKMRKLMSEKKYSLLSPCRSCNLIWSNKNFLDLKNEKNIITTLGRKYFWKYLEYNHEKNNQK